MNNINYDKLNIKSNESNLSVSKEEMKEKIKKSKQENPCSKTSRSDRRNAAWEKYINGEISLETAKKIIDLMKTY